MSQIAPAATTDARPYSDEELATIEKRRAAGVPWRKIAEELGRTAAAVKQKAKLERLSRRSATRREARRGRVKAMHSEGLTVEAIAGRLGSDWDTIAADLAALGLSPTPRSTPCRADSPAASGRATSAPSGWPPSPPGR